MGLEAARRGRAGEAAAGGAEERYSLTHSLTHSISQTHSLTHFHSGASGVDESATFQPVVNKRPSYLDSRPDTLDAQMVAGNAKQLVNSNDIFEQALPGNKNYNINSAKIPISPSGDALGKEMKKFNHSNAPVAASKQQQPPTQPTTGYRSKFMQQYETDSNTSQSKYGSNEDYEQQYIPSNGINNKNIKAEKEAEEIFMATLRASNANSNSANYNRKSIGPGWNDDTSTGGLYERTVNRTPNKAKSGTTSNNTLRPSPTQSYAHPEPPSNRHKHQNYDNNGGGWNNDTSINPVSIKKTSPVKAGNEPIISPRIRPSEDVVVTQARSRLSLLKSKIRKSESSGSSRSDSAYMRSNSAEYDDGITDNYNDYNAIHSSLPGVLPKSAPAKKNVAAPAKDRFPADQSQPRRPSKPSINDVDTPNTYSNMYNNNSRVGKSNQNNNYPMEERPQASKPKVSSNSYDETDDYEYGNGMNSSQNANASMELGEQHECPDCGRRFNAGPFERHIKICKKVFQQKRKVFDSTKMRVQDNPELVKILKTKGKSSGSNSNSAATSKAKRQIAVLSITISSVFIIPYNHSYYTFAIKPLTYVSITTGTRTSCC